MASVGGVKRAPDDHRSPSTSPSRRRSLGASTAACVGAFVLLVAACGGDDDAESPASTSAPSQTVTIAPTSTLAPTTTVATTTTTLPPLELVTDGATVVVANASGVDGAAGRMSDAIAIAGFSIGDATNSSEGQISTSKIYYDPDNANALAVANSLREALGGGDIEVLELTVPAPLGDPDALGDASIILAMGNDTADKTLDELQGRVAPATTAATTDTTDTDDTTDTTTEASGDESGG